MGKFDILFQVLFPVLFEIPIYSDCTTAVLYQKMESPVDTGKQQGVFLPVPNAALLSFASLRVSSWLKIDSVTSVLSVAINAFCSFYFS
jgi:hypothetical protein